MILIADLSLRSSSRLSPVASPPLQNRPHRNPPRPIRKPRLVLIIPRASSDIQMHPGRLTHKLLQEHRRRNRPTPPISTRIPHISNMALDLILVIIGAGKPPELLARNLRGVHKLLPR